MVYFNVLSQDASGGSEKTHKTLARTVCLWDRNGSSSNSVKCHRWAAVSSVFTSPQACHILYLWVRAGNASCNAPLQGLAACQNLLLLHDAQKEGQKLKGSADVAVVWWAWFNRRKHFVEPVQLQVTLLWPYVRLQRSLQQCHTAARKQLARGANHCVGIIHLHIHNPHTDFTWGQGGSFPRQ